MALSSDRCMCEALICLGCLLFPKGAVALMGGSSQLEADSVAYMLWMTPAMFFIYVESIGMMLIRLDGSPKYSMAVQVVAAMLNIILDWVFIFPLGWGGGSCRRNLDQLRRGRCNGFHIFHMDVRQAASWTCSCTVAKPPIR